MTQDQKMTNEDLVRNICIYNDGQPTDELWGWGFWCIGCESVHTIPSDGRWTYTGGPLNPTFYPSLGLGRRTTEYKCHLLITNGQIQYLADSKHDLAGQLVDMVPFDDFVNPDLTYKR